MKKYITPELIKKAGEFAKAGFSDKQIYLTLELSPLAFYRHVELIETVRDAKMRLKEEVADALLKSAVIRDDNASVHFLSRRLGLFQSTYKSGPLKRAADAIIELERLYQANDEMPLDLMDAIGGIINDFVRTLNVSELKLCLEDIEQNLANNIETSQERYL